MVSVIVPIYNSELYLEKCLESLKKQTYSDLEIICVNDGSTDNSLKIIESYMEIDCRFRILTQINSGQGVARNYGVSECSGEYVMFVDSDDWLEENCIELLLEALVKNNAELSIGTSPSVRNTRR